MQHKPMILGLRLMGKWGIDEYEMLQMIKQGLEFQGSFNTKVEVAKLISSEDAPTDLSLIPKLQFLPDDVEKFDGKYAAILDRKTEQKMNSNQMLQSCFKDLILNQKIHFKNYEEVLSHPSMEKILREQGLSVESRKVREYLRPIAAKYHPHLQKAGRPKKA